MTPEPIAQFKIYPNNKALFYWVFVWRTIADLRRAIGPGHSHTLGLCRSSRTIRIYGIGDKRKDRMTPCIGEIHFCKKWLRSGIIAHELTHALFGWMAERRLTVATAHPLDRSGGKLKRNSSEEIACHAMGEMYRQVCVELTKSKLI
jgi:hypothetical protein